MSVRTGSRTLTLAWLAAFLLTGAPVHAQTSEYQAVILHSSALDLSKAFRIDDAGEIVGLGVINGQQAALLWTGAGTSFRSLNPGVGFSSIANDIAGTRIAGSVSPTGHPETLQATLFNAHSTTTAALHPAGFVQSAALGVDGDLVVGWGGGASTSWAQHALLWTSLTPTGFVDLNPSHLSFLYSEAIAIDATQGEQVGRGTALTDLSIDGNTITQTHQLRALLWRGSAASAVDLHPAGFDESQAFAVSGPRQAGFGKPAGSPTNHALLWQGTAASVVDLHPAGFTESGVNGMRGTRQVGAAWGPSTGGEAHAMLWLGTAASAVDLHRFLPVDSGNGSALFRSSAAFGVDAHGNVVGRAATNAGVEQAVLWQRLADLHQIRFPDAFTTPGARYERLFVTLDGPTPRDEIVTLTSSRPDITTLPRVGGAGAPGAAMLVPSGASEGITGISFAPVATRTIVVITATARGRSRSATMVVVPSTLTSVHFAGTSVVGGSATTATVTLDGPAPAGGAVVQLLGSTTTASWPSSVTVPSGATSVSFTVQTRVPSAASLSTLTARYAGVSRQDTLWVIRPIPIPIPASIGR
jgi:hypothetical protein